MLTVSFKAPMPVIDALRDMLKRNYIRVRSEIDAAKSLSESDRRLAMLKLQREEFQIETVARFFEVTLPTTKEEIDRESGS